MKTVLNNRWLIPAFRLLLGGIFLAASISKILDRSGFVSTVAGYGLLPRPLAEAYGWAIPWVELCLGSSLLLGVMPRLSAAISLPVIASFVVASGYALVKAPGSTCGCFGNFIVLSHPVSLTIDAAMLLLSASILFSRRPEFLTAGQVIDRINPRYRREVKACYYSSLLVILALGMVAITLMAYGGQKLSVQAMVLPVKPQSVLIPPPFSESVSASLKQGKPVLVFVYFQGCSACEDATPIVRQLADEYAANATYLPIDYDKYTQQVLEMGVSATPTVYVVTRDNEDGTFGVAKSFTGSIEMEPLKAALQKAVASAR